MLQKLKSYSRLALIFLIFLLAVSLARNIGRDISARDRVNEAQMTVEELEAENKKLEEKLEYVKSDDYTEAQLRNKLGLVKEGETLVVLPDEETIKRLAYKNEEEKDALPPPNWKKWARIFEIPLLP